MKRAIIASKLTIIIVIITIVCGCPIENLPPSVYTVGKTIKNPPVWITEESGDAFSEWMEWTDNQPLSNYIPKSFNKSGYTGKYRLLANVQNFAIEFDDGTAGTFLFLWLGDIEGNNTEVTIQQTDPAIFSFEGYIKYQYTDAPKEKASITYTRKETTKSYSKIAVQLDIAGQQIINSYFTSPKKDYYTINTLPQWLPNKFAEPDTGDIKYQFSLWNTPDIPIASKGFMCFGVSRYGYDSLGKQPPTSFSTTAA